MQPHQKSGGGGGGEYENHHKKRLSFGGLCSLRIGSHGRHLGDGKLHQHSGDYVYDFAAVVEARGGGGVFLKFLPFALFRFVLIIILLFTHSHCNIITLGSRGCNELGAFFLFCLFRFVFSFHNDVPFHPSL